MNKRLEGIKNDYRNGFPVNIPYLIQQLEQKEHASNTALEQVYVTQDRNERLQERVEELEGENQRYKQALKEIKKLTIYDAGTEEQVYLIADKALKEGETEWGKLSLEGNQLKIMEILNGFMVVRLYLTKKN